MPASRFGRSAIALLRSLALLAIAGTGCASKSSSPTASSSGDAAAVAPMCGSAPCPTPASLTTISGGSGDPNGYIDLIRVNGDTVVVLYADPVPGPYYTDDVYAAPKAGGPARLLLKTVGPLRDFPTFAVSATDAYVGDELQNRVAKIPLSGAPPTTFETYNAYPVGISDGWLYLASGDGSRVPVGPNSGGPSWAIDRKVAAPCIDDHAYYFFDVADSMALLEYPFDAVSQPPAPDTYVGLGSLPGFITLTACGAPDAVYVSSGENQPWLLGYVPKSGGTFTPISGLNTSVTAMAADASGFYFCADGLRWIPYMGAPPQKISAVCGALALDDTSIYMGVLDTVYSTPKPAPISPPLDGGGGAGPDASRDAGTGPGSGCAYTTCPASVQCGAPSGSSGTFALECVDAPPVTPTLRSSATCELVEGSAPAVFTFPPPYTCSTAQITCAWPEGTVTCPASWLVPAQGGGMSVNGGCCGFLTSTDAKPSCGVQGNPYCAPPGPNDMPE